MQIENFNHTIDQWEKDLAQYDFTQLCAKPAPHSWSLGQLYRHLIADTQFYLEQIKICITNNDHATEEASPAAKAMFLHNGFPDENLKGSPANAWITQPDSTEQLKGDLLKLKAEMNKAATLISESPFKGKTKHPGLCYFNAAQWLQFADMHFRHHLRQKKKIEIFLSDHKL